MPDKNVVKATAGNNMGGNMVSMTCPYIAPETEEVCRAIIEVRAWPGTPWSREDQGDDPTWEAHGCHHVEGQMDERTQYCIQRKVEEKEADAKARAEEAAIARAEDRADERRVRRGKR